MHIGKNIFIFDEYVTLGLWRGFKRIQMLSRYTSHFIASQADKGQGCCDNKNLSRIKCFF